MQVESQPTSGELIPYPNGVVRQLLRLPILLYRLGLGTLVSAVDIMILTTRGRKSGHARHTAIEFRRHGNKVYIVSAWGQRPQWYRNLLADPAVTVRVGGEALRARARIVDDPGEALRVLHLFRRSNPTYYASVLAKLSDDRARDVKTLPDVSPMFTIVCLDRDDTLPTYALPPLAVDLAWLLPVTAVGMTTLFGLLLFARARRS